MASRGSPSSCLEFLKNMGKLKHLPRTGWVLRDVHQPETVSGHMYRMAMAAMLLDSSDKVDTNRVLRMCLVHDMAECVVGDITPVCGVSVEDKHNMEMAAMNTLSALAAPSSGEEMSQLFKEYEAQETPESHIVKDLDKFDMILQAYEYEVAQNKPGHLEEFFKNTEGVFRHPRILTWVQELYNQRQEYLKSANANKDES